MCVCEWRRLCVYKHYCKESVKQASIGHSVEYFGVMHPIPIWLNWIPACCFLLEYNHTSGKRLVVKKVVGFTLPWGGQVREYLRRWATVGCSGSLWLVLRRQRQKASQWPDSFLPGDFSEWPSHSWIFSSTLGQPVHGWQSGQQLQKTINKNLASLLLTKKYVME